MPLSRLDDLRRCVKSVLFAAAAPPAPAPPAYVHPTGSNPMTY